MRLQGPQFLRSVIRNTAAGFADLFLVKLGTTLAFILLVRLLTEEDIGALGVASGYLVLLLFLDVKPAVVLLRDYPKIAADRAERDLHLTAYLLFWAVQTVGILLISLGLQSLVLDRLGIPGLSFLFLGLTVDFLAVTLGELVKTVFYADLRQGAATRIGLWLGVLRLASLAVLLWRPALATYSWLLIATSAASALVWLLVLRRGLGFRPLLSRRIPALLRESLSEYALWNHGQTVVTSTLLLVDTLILSLAGAPLADIGHYTIALRFTSVFFFQALWQLSRSLQVVLSHQSAQGDPGGDLARSHRSHRTINTFLKLAVVISAVQLATVLVAGEPLIGLLFGADVAPEVYRFALITGMGAAVMNLGWPLIGVVRTFCSLRQSFFEVFLPALAAGVLIYSLAAWGWGAVGVAYGNILVYATLVLLLGVFLKRRFPFPLDPRWVTAEEKAAVRELFRRGSPPDPLSRSASEP